MAYRMLSAFETLFEGKPFLHRRPNQGDAVAAELYEDLYELARSKSFVEHVKKHRCGLNSGNIVIGKVSRRGDGTFGEFVPNIQASVVPGFSIAQGHLATLQIGIETKIFSTALGKQRRERVGDLNDQATTFERTNKDAIRVAIIGVNHASSYASYEGERITKTDGKKYKHPADEAPAMVTMLKQEVQPNFDEMILLEYRAPNQAPFPFEWLASERVSREYGAALLRISNLYETRFGN